MRFVKILAAALLCATTSAHAWTHGVSSGAPIGPILSAVSYPFGAMTRTGYGSVRLNAVALGLVSPLGTTPVSYTVSAAHNHSTYWTVPAAGVAEGATAITPLPSSTGVSNSLGGGGSSEQFDVTACDAASNCTTLANALTINMVANAANWGDQTFTASSFFGNKTASGIANFVAGDANNLGCTLTVNPSGCQILLSVGFNIQWLYPALRRPFLQAAIFTAAAPVVVHNADNSRPALLSNINIYNDAYLTWDGIDLTGNPVSDQNGGTSTTGFAIYGLDSYVTVKNSKVHYAFDTNGYPTWNTGTSTAVVFTGPDDHTSLINLELFNVGQGITGGTGETNAYLSGISVHDYTNNAFFISSFQSSQINDTRIYAPQQYDDNHVDSFQIVTGTAPTNLLIQRLQVYGAYGNSSQQGPIFSGDVQEYGLNGSTPTAYLDDGSGTGTAGNTLTVPYGLTPYSAVSAPGTPITWVGAPSGVWRVTAKIDSTHFTVKQDGSTPNNPTSATASAGSSSSPVPFWTGQSIVNMTGVIYASADGNGATVPSGGMNISKFAYIHQDVVNPYINTFLGSCNGTRTITVSYWQFGYGIDAVAYIYLGANTQGTNLGVSSGTTIPFSVGGSGSFTLSSHAPVCPSTGGVVQMTASTGGVDTNYPTLTFYHVNLPAEYSITNSIDHGFMMSGTSPAYYNVGNGVGTQPSGVTIDSTASFGGTALSTQYSTMAAAFFGNGSTQNAEQYLETEALAISIATPPATVTQLLSSAFVPKVGGVCDAGDHVTSLCALTFAGKWNDGSGIAP